MKNLPYLLVEAMAIAGLVCGAEKGFRINRTSVKASFQELFS